MKSVRVLQSDASQSPPLGSLQLVHAPSLRGRGRSGDANICCVSVETKSPAQTVLFGRSTRQTNLNKLAPSSDGPRSTSWPVYWLAASGEATWQRAPEHESRSG